MGHTPGPWIIGGHGSMAEGVLGTPGRKHGRFRRVLADTGVVARVYCGDEESSGVDAMHHNVTLVAAAPDLLEAARLANQELLALGQGSSASPALRALWSAIAKAEGRTE